MKVVIIGNGIAGVMTASKLRELEGNASKLEIDIYTREPYPYYARIRLPEIFGLNKIIRDLQIFKDDWYEKKMINVHYNFNVTSILPAEKKIRFEDGKETGFDKLILACGADSIIPDIKNNKLSGIFKIREYIDAMAIKTHMEAGAKQAVVLGGGLLGLEAARYMRTIKDITIVEVYPRLLPKQLDEDGALILKDIIENMGIKVILSSEAVEFIGDKKLEGLKLKSGQTLNADTAVVAMGIRPRTGLAKEAGLDVNRGVVVNEYLRTSFPDIYAVGDLVEFQNIVWGIIPAALEHAPIAAQNVFSGDEYVYQQTVPRTSLKVVGVDMTSIGKILLSPEEMKEHEIIVHKDKEKRTYEKYVLKDNILQGAIILGNKARVKWVEQNIGKKIEKNML